MVISCCAIGCTNRQKKGVRVGFHRFPFKRPHLLKQWILAIRRRNWQPTVFSKLCNDHFTDDCFKSRARHFLNKDAVPTLFNFNTLDTKKKQVKKLPSNIEIQKKIVTSPIIIKDFQHIPSNSPAHDQPVTLSSQGQSSTTIENVQHTSSNSSLHSQQLCTLPQKEDGESPIVTGDISSETSLSPTITESIHSSFPLNSKQSSSSEQKSTEDPTNNTTLQSFFSNFLLSEQEMIINILREQNPVHASSLENPTDSGNNSDYSMDIPQQQLAFPAATVEDQACNKSDSSSSVFQKIALSVEGKCAKTEVGLLREKVRNLETHVKQKNEEIFKLKKLLDLSLKYIGIPVKIEHLLSDESVLQCLLES